MAGFHAERPSPPRDWRWWMTVVASTGQQPTGTEESPFCCPTLWRSRASHGPSGQRAYTRGRMVDMVMVEAKGEFLDQLGPAIRVVNLAARRVLWAIPRLVSYLARTPMR